LAGAYYGFCSWRSQQQRTIGGERIGFAVQSFRKEIYLNGLVGRVKLVKYSNRLSVNWSEPEFTQF